MTSHSLGTCEATTCSACARDEWPKCEDCGDPIEPGTGCHHGEHDWCASCFVERCQECRADMRDDMAADYARDEDR